MTDESINEEKNENIAVKVARQPGGVVKFDISVTPEAVKAAHLKAIKSVNKEISIPGFRKGKAPDKFVMEKYPKEIQQELRDLVIHIGLNEAMGLTKLQPFRKESIRCTAIEKITLDEGAKFTIEFEAAPSIPQVDTTNLTLHDAPQRAIAQKDIDQVVENIRYHYAKWTKVTDRTVQDNDFIDLDIDKLDEPREEICRDSRFHAKKGIMAPWMYNLVIGLKLDESVEGVSEREDSPESEFVPTKCQITVKGIHTAELPELNEEFIKKLGVTSLEDLHTRIEADLNKRAADETQQHLRRQIDEWLLSQYSFDVPKSVIDQETKDRKQEVEMRMQEDHLSEAEIEKRLSEIEHHIRRDVEHSYRLFFLLLSYAKEHNITVTNEEVADELMRRVSMGAYRDLQNVDSSAEIRSRINQQLLLRKCHDHIIQHVRLEKH